MIFRIFKNTFPALFIVWTVYFLELALYDTGVEKDQVYYFQQLKIFASYTILGLIIGGLSAGMFAKKKKKYSFTFENDLKKYLKYFLKNAGVSFLALLSLVLREVINNPLLFSDTLLHNSFWLRGLFIFIRDKFSPMYFTVFFTIIIIMSIHNLVKNLSLYHGTNRALAYFTAVILSGILIFNYGFLNASEKARLKNVVLIGAENLERSFLSASNIKDRSALKELKSHSYDFENCFAPVLDPKAVILSVLTSSDPEKWEYADGLLSINSQNHTVFAKLKESNVNAENFSDIEFRFERTVSEDPVAPVFATTAEKSRSEVLVSHCLSPIIFNSKIRAGLFPEAGLISGYRERTYLKNKISGSVGRKDKNFLVYYTIPDFRDHLPYPYYRLADEKPEEAYLNYLNDEINMIYKELKNEEGADNTVICLFGIPANKDGLNVKSYQIPIYLSSKEYGIERKVKNRYTTMDILPTVLDAAGYDIKKFSFEGKSFFDPEFIRQDILLTDISLLRKTEDVKFKNEDGFESKNQDLKNEIYPLFPRSLIISDMKLNAYPQQTGVKYELFDLSKDPEEQNDLSNSNPSAVRSMKSALEARMKKIYNYKVTNGYFLK